MITAPTSPRWLIQPLTWLNAALPPILWAGCIFFFSSQPVLPGLELSSVDFLMKKLAHITIYAMLYLLLVRASFILYPIKNHHSAAKKYWLAPLAICLLYAISDEVHQGLTGGNRSPSVRDVVYDMLGASIIFLKQYRYI